MFKKIRDYTLTSLLFYPLDTIAVRYQTKKNSGSILKNISKIFRNEGILSFYRGFIYNITGKVFFWMLFTYSYKTLGNKINFDEHLTKKNSHFVKASLSTIIATTFSNCCFVKMNRNQNVNYYQPKKIWELLKLSSRGLLLSYIKNTDIVISLMLAKYLEEYFNVKEFWSLTFAKFGVGILFYPIINLRTNIRNVNSLNYNKMRLIQVIARRSFAGCSLYVVQSAIKFAIITNNI